MPPVPSGPTNNKKRIVKDFDSLPEELISRIKLEYPYGFVQNLVSYTNKEGNKVSALPFETEDIYYLIRMTKQEANRIIEEDVDYSEDGVLREDFVLESNEAAAAHEDDDEGTGNDEDDASHYTDIPDTSRRPDEMDDD